MNGSNVAVALESLLASDILEPQINRYLDRIRGLDGHSAYNTQLALNGRAAAEAGLAKMRSEHFMDAFAGCIQSTARGMLDVAKTSHPSRPLIHMTYFKPGADIPMATNFNGGSMILLESSELYNRAPRSSEGADIFGKCGSLELKVVVLIFGLGRQEFTKGIMTATLGLVLPLIRGEKSGEETAGFRLVEICLNGVASASTYTPSIQPDRYITNKFGLERDNPCLVTGEQNGGKLDRHLGFDDARKFLATHLPNLGSSLSRAAERLGKQP